VTEFLSGVIQETDYVEPLSFLMHIDDYAKLLRHYDTLGITAGPFLAMLRICLEIN